jgi:hypothetical protein
MKNLLLIALTLFVFVSCSKKDEVEPDLATEVAGIYQATKAEIQGVAVTLPQAGVSMGLRLTKLTSNTANFLLTANVAGDITEQGGEVDLKKDGEKIMLTVEGAALGYVLGKNIFLDFISVDGQRVKVEGNK